MKPLVRLNEFQRVLAEVDCVSLLKVAHVQLTAAHALARRMNLTLEDQNKLAELRIRIARKAGTLLRKTVSRGGSSHGGSSVPTGSTTRKSLS